ncbi:MAG: head GIN domain-containing protein [Bacteroidota bacterium]
MNLTARLFIITALVLNVSALSGQNRETRETEPFEKLVVTGKIKVELVVSSSNQLSVTVRDGSPDRVITEVVKGELRIRLKPELGSDPEIAVKVPCSSLYELEAAAGATITSRDVLKEKELIFRILSVGKIELNVEAESIDGTVTQGGDLILYGKTDILTVNANTGGNFLGYELEANDTYVKAGSGAQAKVVARRIIDATANSKGYIGYKGEPVSTYVKTSLGGEIASFRDEQLRDN